MYKPPKVATSQLLKVTKGRPLFFRKSQNLTLFSVYFKVRKATADSLYTALITYDDIASDESVEEVLNILSETLW